MGPMLRLSSALLFSTIVASAEAPIARAQSAADSVNADPSVRKSAQHLEAASDLLAQVPEPADEEAAKRIADLRRHYAAMLALYRGETSPSITTSETEEGSRPRDWKDLFSDVERDLTKILGSGPSLGPPTGIPVAPATAAGVHEVDPSKTLAPGETPATKTAESPVVATANPDSPAGNFPGADLFAIAAAKAGPVGFPDLDPTVRQPLERLRVELELFYAYALSETSSGKKKPASF